MSFAFVVRTYPARILTGLVAGATVASFVAFAPQARADSAPSTAEPATVSNDALPTVQINGVVWSQVVIGETVYVGGSFTSARPAGSPVGSNETPRANILAYNIKTGALVNSFAPSFNGQVLNLAASPDGSRLYAVGDFTNVNGTNRFRIAALNPADGSLVTSFAPGVDARVKAVVATADTVYFGGIFSSVSGAPRTRLAAVRASNGTVLDWAPAASGGGNQVTAMALTPDSSKVVVGGHFASLAGQNAYALGAVDPVSGERVTWMEQDLVPAPSNTQGITSLKTTPAGVIGTGYAFGAPRGLETAFLADSAGQLTWVNGCYGDNYDSYTQSDVTYLVGHSHDCRSINGFVERTPREHYRATAVTTEATQLNVRGTVSGYVDHGGMPAPSPLTWYPNLDAGTFTGQSQGAWSISGNDDYVVLGGEFPRVNGRAQQGLVRFAKTSLAPNARGPELAGAAYRPTLTSPAAGVVQGAIEANIDNDNEDLKYEVLRNGAVVHTEQTRSNFYNRPMINFIDQGLTPGATVGYRIRVTDPHGNSAIGETVTITVSGSGTLNDYNRAVLADGAKHYWRLDETAGPTLADIATASNGTAAAGVAFGATAGGQLGGAATFNGTSTGTIASAVQEDADYLHRISIEAWINTTTTRGGKIVGFGDRQTGGSSNHDRQIYMTSNGRLAMGARPDSRRAVTSTASYNDGNWHHVVGQLGPQGMQLFVDGVLVAQDDQVTTGRSMNGYWRIGGDSLASYPNRPTSDYFAGMISNVAVYNNPLAQAQISSHYALGNPSALPNSAPTAAFTSTPGADGVVDFDATASADTDGTIVSYEWDFGDGTTGSGATTQHTYGASGTYQVTVTVIDNAGASSVLTLPVNVELPNQDPQAAFDVTTSDLAIAVDASGSTDADGSVVSYDWDFGDGATGSGSVANHTYGAAGTYTVSLTVSDNDGASQTVSREVTVVAPPVEIATDDFARSVTGGWGNAVRGGAWGRSGSAASFSVAGGLGVMSVPAGNSRATFLDAIDRTATDTVVDVTLARPIGGSTFVSVIGRRVDATNDYRAKLRLNQDGSTTVSLVRTVNGVETTFASSNLSGLVLTNGETLRVRVQVQGTNATAVRAKVWKVGQAEPVNWNAQANDNTAALQTDGGIGLLVYVGGGVTNGPVVARFDNLVVNPL